MAIIIIIMLAAIILAIAVFLIIHQRKLKLRAYLMQEAIRNRDFQFRLPSRGLLWGERAMQDTLNNVGQELRKQIAANEVESWQKLTRVLTHEIMNAITPIASISQAFLGRTDVKGTPIEDGIRAIHETSVGLKTFVDSYRKLTQLQTPQPTITNIYNLVESISPLFPAIKWEYAAINNTKVKTDEGLFRQIVINMAKNAQEAGATRLSFQLVPSNAPNAAIALLVSNDGAPIPTELRKDIFTPFFTTKQMGSGIGLSLSRQIMVLQGGDLQLADVPSPEFHTTFIISFAPIYK